MVEVAIGIPVLLLLVFGVIEFGIVWERNHTVSQEVREVARNAVVADYDPASVCGAATTNEETVACQAVDRVGNDASALVIVEGADVDSGQEITVCANITYQAITGLLNPFLDNKTLLSSTTLLVEQPGLTATVGTPWGSDPPDAGDCS